MTENNGVPEDTAIPDSAIEELRRLLETDDPQAVVSFLNRTAALHPEAGRLLVAMAVSREAGSVRDEVWDAVLLSAPAECLSICARHGLSEKRLERGFRAVFEHETGSRETKRFARPLSNR